MRFNMEHLILGYLIIILTKVVCTYINVVNSVYSKTSINGGGRAADSPPFPSYDFNYYSPTRRILIWITMCIVYSNSVTMPFCRLHLIV